MIEGRDGNQADGNQALVTATGQPGQLRLGQLQPGDGPPPQGPPPQGPASQGSHGGELHRALSSVMIVIIVGLIPWTAYLAISLPGHFRAHDWSVAWVGFDAALIAVLAYTAWAAWFRRQILAPTAIIAATMLLCDAWFDVNTSFGTGGEAVAILTAVLCNLPLAIFFFWLARRIMLRTAAVIAAATGDSTLPRHVRDVRMPFARTWSHPLAEARPEAQSANAQSADAQFADAQFADAQSASAQSADAPSSEQGEAAPGSRD